MKLVRIWPLIALALFPSQVRSDTLVFSFPDPVGDFTGDIDVTGMSVLFDDTTGAYEIVLVTSVQHPFSGAFRINVNLFDPDTGSTECAQSFLKDVLNDFDLDTPERRIELTGVASSLLNWAPGHRVATNDLPFGTPDCNAGFSSAVTEIPFAPPYPRDWIALGDVFAVIYVRVFADGFESGDTSHWSAAVP